MSESCCVPLCSKGILFFEFPKDAIMKNEWISKIPRVNWAVTNYTRICDAHFHASCMIQVTDERGSKQVVWQLKEDAIPTIFVRSNKRYKINELKDDTISPEDDKINSITEIPQHSNKFRAHNFTICYRDRKIFFLKMCLETTPKILCSLAIANDYRIEMYQYTKKVNPNELKMLLGEGLKCNLYSKLKVLLDLLDNEINEEDTKEELEQSVEVGSLFKIHNMEDQTDDDSDYYN